MLSSDALLQLSGITIEMGVLGVLDFEPGQSQATYEIGTSSLSGLCPVIDVCCAADGLFSQESIEFTQRFSITAFGTGSVVFQAIVEVSQSLILYPYLSPYLVGVCTRRAQVSRCA